MNRPELIILAGPTASGKTEAAIELAKYFDTVIVSADSRQFYCEMSIGTAKPNSRELQDAKHYFINSHSIHSPFSVGAFERECLALLDALFKTRDKVILVGGSGLFIKAIAEGFDDIPTADEQIREMLNKQLAVNGIGYIQQKLKAADPNYFLEIDVSNPQRIIRALEVFESTGKPFSSFQKAKINKRPFEILTFGLDMDRQRLYQRINQRVDGMIKQGLIEEARSLLPYRHLNALNTVGYSELFDYFDHNITLDAAIELIKQNTRRFAKRQLTWFGKDKTINWFNAENADLIKNMISIVNPL